MRCRTATIEGTVDERAPASGSEFSLLPPENATGNFTKIVQRVPVRIAVPADGRRAALLRPGMSVVVRIDTQPARRRRSCGRRAAAERPLPLRAEALEAGEQRVHAMASSRQP